MRTPIRRRIAARDTWKSRGADSFLMLSPLRHEMDVKRIFCYCRTQVKRQMSTWPDRHIHLFIMGEDGSNYFTAKLAVLNICLSADVQSNADEIKRNKSITLQCAIYMSVLDLLIITATRSVTDRINRRASSKMERSHHECTSDSSSWKEEEIKTSTSRFVSVSMREQLDD